MNSINVYFIINEKDQEMVSLEESKNTQIKDLEVKISELYKNIEALSSDSTGQAQLLADKDNIIYSLQTELKNFKIQKVIFKFSKFQIFNKLYLTLLK